MSSIITLDYETYYDKEYSLKKLPTLLYVADPRFKIHGVGIKIDDRPCEWVTDMEIANKELRKMTNHSLLAHNTKFDGLILQYYYNILFTRYLDTLSMAAGINPHGSASLDALCKMLWPTDETMRKGDELADFEGVRDLTPEQSKVLGDYCINDCDITYAAYQQMPWYPEAELDLIDLTCKMYIRPKLFLDADLVKAHMEDVQEQRDIAVADTPYDQSIFSSNNKYADLLQNTYGLETPTKISATTGKTTHAFGKNDLPYIQFRAKHPELNNIWLARERVKSTQEISRSKRLLEATACDNRQLRVPLKYYAAHTGRYGGGEKLNLQNLGRKSKLRLALLAGKNQFVYVRDLSQIEARVNAAVAGQLDLVEQFRRGEDVYSIFASDVYNRRIDRKRVDTNKDGEEYYPDATEGFVGKVCILGLGYNMSGPTLVNTLAVGALGGEPVYFTPEEGYRIVTTYRTKNNMIVAAWKQCDSFIIHMLSKDTNYAWGPLRIQKERILLPNGMALNYPRLCHRETKFGMAWCYMSRNGWTTIYGGKLWENIIQALARIIITDAMVRIEKELDDCYVALNVHDEILTIGPDNDPEAIDKATEEILNATPTWLPNLPVTSEGGWAKNYSK